MGQTQSKHVLALGILLSALFMILSGFASAADETDTTQLIINDGKQDQLTEDVETTTEPLEKSVDQKTASQESSKHPETDNE